MILLKHFKKVKSDKDSSELVHEKGHRVTIAHKGLSDKMRAELDSMPHMSDGGEVSHLHDDYSQSDSDVQRTRVQDNMQGRPAPVHQDTDAEYNQRKKDFGKNAPRIQMPSGMDDGGDSVEDNPLAQPAPAEPMMSPMSPEQMQSIPNAQPSAPQGMPNPQQDMLKQMESQAAQSNQAQQQYAQAQAEQGAKESKAYQENQQKQVELQTLHQQNLMNQDKEMQAWVNDAKAGHIDPKHYINNMSGGQKVATAIGLLLGGISAGLSGGPNPVMKILEDNINRDVEAQKANSEQKNNIFRAMQQRYGNQRDATAATQLFYRNMMVDKVMQAAAQNKGPAAQLQAQMFKAQQDQQMLPIKMQLATVQTINDGLQKGLVSPEQAIQYKVPKEQQKAVFDEIGKARNVAQNEKEILGSFDKASNENTILKTGAGMLRTPASVTTMQNLLLPAIKDNEGRVNEFEFETVKKLLPQPGDTDAKIAEKRKGLINFIEAKKAAPTAKGFGIPVPDSGASKFKPIQGR